MPSCINFRQKVMIIKLQLDLLLDWCNEILGLKY